MRKIVTLTLALACGVIGVVLVFIPGPAVVFFLLAGGLLAMEYRPVARFLDRGELWLRKFAAQACQQWRQLPVVVRVALVALSVCVLAAMAFMVFRLYRG